MDEIDGFGTVERLTVYPRAGSLKHYVRQTGEDGETIWYRAQSRQLAAPESPVPNAKPITPDQLAKLLAQQLQ